MKREYLLGLLFLIFTAVFVYLFYRLIIPFLVPIAWASVFVILFYPLYQRLLRRIHSPGACALIMCLCILLLIIGPLGYLFAMIVSEAADAVAAVNEMYEAGEFDEILRATPPWLEAVKLRLSQYFDISKLNVDELIRDGLDNITGIIFAQTSWLITNATRAIFHFVLMLFTMFYFFRDGAELVRKVKRLVPLPTEQVDRVTEKLRDVIYATMYGGLIVALIQGTLGGILFAAVGIPSALFWAALMFFLSIIPVFGAFIVYIPAGIILILGGSVVKGLLVIAIGTVVISQSDNIIRPYLVAGRTEMHPLLLFFAIMGGVAMFGLLGLVIGPLIAAVFVALVRLLEIRMHTPEDGQSEADSAGAAPPAPTSRP